MKKLKWSVGMLGSLFISYHLLSPQSKANVFGAYQSIINSSRASWILYQSVYDYSNELGAIPYNTDEYHKKRSQIHYRVANRILQLSKQNKGIYLKLGQYLGNLERAVPREFTQILKVLQDSGPSIPYEEIKVVLEQDLKMSPKQIFQSFQENAFSAASLAQVHEGRLDGKRVAVKIQFPYLKSQSKWDLQVLSKITNFCNYLMQKWNYHDVDLLKIFYTWTSTLVEELNFQTQITNALKTKQIFKDNPYVHVPEVYQKISSQRIIVMEYAEGVKINQPEKMKNLNIDTKVVAKNLVDIFGKMIFKYGFVHCDAHPGNILVAKANNKKGHKIILLDHGLYRTLDRQVVVNFSHLWKALILSDRKNLQKYAEKFNLEKHIEYLPIIFLHRTMDSRKKIGAPVTPEERKKIHQKNLITFESIHAMIQDLHPDLMFIIKATNLISTHNLTLGGTQRERLLTFTRMCLQNSTRNNWMALWLVQIRIWIFEHFYGIYRWIFGTS